MTNFRPELVRPTQGSTSVIRISPNPRQWTAPVVSEQQQSVILQHALTTPANQAPGESETSQISTGNMIILLFNHLCIIFLGTLYCVLPQSHDKNLMIIKNECKLENEKYEDSQQSFQAVSQRQVHKSIYLCVYLDNHFIILAYTK